MQFIITAKQSDQMKHRKGLMTHKKLKLVIAKNRKLSHGGLSQRQVSCTNPPMKVLGHGRY